MANYYFALLIFKLVGLIVVNGYYSDLEYPSVHYGINDEIPEIITLHKSCKAYPEQEIFVNLKHNTNSVLANTNLTIWLAHSDCELESISQSVMDDIGPFFMYHDLDSCSAAVYFFKRQQFDGTVDNRYIINAVPYNVAIKKAKPSKYNMIQTGELKHPEVQSMKGSLFDLSGSLVIEENEAQEIEKSKWINIKSKFKYPNNVYIETLVIVNYDMVDKFEKNYVSLVSNILVTFNTVDMLYAKLEKPKIKINIAGIIIGTNRESFPAILKRKCYESSELSDEEEMEANCTASAIKSTLFKYKKTFPANSYDVVVFLTNHNFHTHTLNSDGNIETLPVDGAAFTPEDTYKGYKISPNDARVVVATNFDDAYQSFPVIAHEMAHLFNVLHDQGNLRKDNGDCNANIMRTDGTFCKRCLIFSGTTAEQFYDFFGTRESCIFLNKPRSLYYPPRPHVSMNEDEQCQCYGFDAARKFDQTFWDQIRSIFQSGLYCRVRLQCVSHRIHSSPPISFKTTFPMDGTPCDSNRVCWNKKCTKIDG